MQIKRTIVKLVSVSLEIVPNSDAPNENLAWTWTLNIKTDQGTIPITGSAATTEACIGNARGAIHELGVRPDGQVVLSYIEE